MKPSGVSRAAKVLLLMVAGWLCYQPALQGSHIVGGEIYYDCLGNDQYRITMKIYRDCYNGIPDFDNPAIIGVFDSAGTWVKTLQIYSLTVTNIPVVLDNPCLLPPPDVCVEEGVYTHTVTLPYLPGGYKLAYQSCCRNQTIQNLMDPRNQGATYMVSIPDSVLAGCNNTPRFKDFPPVAICSDAPLVFDHSAVDTDGDSLVYSLCTPFQGSLGPNTTVPPPPPPYIPVNYSFSYSASYPLNANPPLSIDPNTGLITGKPNVLGQFVVGVCVSEYRNGVLINTVRRDFQFNVANCDKITEAVIFVPPGDTSINDCKRLTINFGNSSTGATTWFWDFGVPGRSDDTSRGKYPSFTFPDTGTYRVMLIANPGVPCNDTDMVTVKVYPLLEADFGMHDVCAKVPLRFTDSSSTYYGTLTKWAWDFGDGKQSSEQNPEHRFTGAGHFPVKLTIRNSFGCKAEAEKYVTVHPIPSTDFTVDGHCVFQPVEFADASSVSNGQIVAWEWFLEDGTLMDTQSNTSAIFESAGMHPVTLVTTSGNGCTDTVTKMVEILGNPVAEAKGDTAVCPDEPVQLMGTGGANYTWGTDNGTLHSNEQNPIVQPLETTTYVFTGSNDCYFDTAHVHVRVLPTPDLRVRPDTSIFHGESLWMYAVTTSGKNLTWQPGNLSFDQPTARFETAPAETTIYTVTTSDANGCETEREVTIVLRPICDRLHIPSAFSPNGDGVNDRFAPIDYGQNDLTEMRIYNRGGQLLFQTQDIGRGWDGSYRGVPIDIGTYVYIIEGTCEQTPVRYQGNVTLLR